MKQIATQALKPLTEAELKNLCTVVNEKKLTATQIKKFSVADLWAIQRNIKKAALRRSF